MFMLAPIQKTDLFMCRLLTPIRRRWVNMAAPARIQRFPAWDRGGQDLQGTWEVDCQVHL